jgi:hypothetical protein
MRSSAFHPEIRIWTSGSRIVRLPCPGHNEFATNSLPSSPPPRVRQTWPAGQSHLNRASSSPFGRVIGNSKSGVIRRTVEASRKILEGANVAACGIFRIITTLELFQHHFSQMGHRETSCDPHLPDKPWSNQRSTTSRVASAAGRLRPNGFIERAQSTSRNFTSSRKRASDKALTFTRTYRELANKPKRLGQFERDNVRLTLQTLRLPSRKLCTTNLPGSLLTSPTHERT